MNKKASILCCAIGLAGLVYGLMNFKYQGISSTATAIAVSLSLVLGATMFLCGIYSFFKGKPTTANNNGEKPMAKKKETKTIGSVSNTSVELMKREKELFDREKEFEKLVSEIKSELAVVQEKISSKGWTAKDGSWVIGDDRN